MIEELDLRVLKAITTDKVNALTFAYRFDHTLFDQPAQQFAKLALDYTKTFRAPPTKRTLLDRHKGNSLFTSEIEYTWNEIENFECDIGEYPYDLQELKKRYQTNAVEVIRRKAAEEDPDNPENPEEYFNKLSLEISRVTSLDLERTHTQRPVGDYIEEFKDRYETRRMNPEATNEIPTGYSMIDTLYGGIAGGELAIVGAETNRGKALNIMTPIATPFGWTTMGELKVGDVVFGDDGKPCNVIATSGIMYNHECYEVEFSDGAKIIADAGHLWKTYTRSDRNALYKNTDEFRARMRATRKSRGTGARQWLVERNKIHRTPGLPIKRKN